MVPYGVEWEFLVMPEDQRPLFTADMTRGERTFRINIIDRTGVVSFTGPPHGPKMIAACVAKSPESTLALLALARPLDESWIDSVTRNLLTFDEHNVGALDASFRTDVLCRNDAGHRAFRVVDAQTRQRSLVPAALGLIVFNLKDHRIVQIHNVYDDIRRKDRGRIRVNGSPTNQLFHYALPDDWAVMP